MNSKKVIISYAFHKKNNLDDFKKFIKSIEKYPPSQKVMLSITVKEISFPMKNRMEKILNDADLGFPIKFHHFPDIGYGLGTHYLINKIYSPDYIIFMSATSQFNNKHWFTLLISPLEKKKVGIVGSMASLESISTDFYELAEIVIKRKFRIKLTQFQELIVVARNLPLKKYYFSFGDKDPALLKIFISFIFKMTKNRIFPLRYRSQIPKFPNPHLRSTGLALKGELLDKIVGQIPATKEEEFLLESGFNGISGKAQQLGYKVYVCNQLGEYFDISDVRASRTFRNSQETSIIIDRHCLVFDNYTKKRQKAIEYLMTTNRGPSFLSI